MPSATSTTSNAGENEALSSNEQPAPAATNETDKVEEKAAKEKVDVTALQTALTDLEDILSKLKEESKKDSYKELVTKTKKVVEDHEVTQEKANQQLDLVEKAIKEVEKAIKQEAEQAKEESNTPKKRGRKGAETPAPKEAPKALPTYTNGTDNYKLADEMRNIVKYLRKNGADAAKIAAIKENYDKLNEKLGLADENGVLSEADFATATANLTSARNTIEAFLNKQSSNGQPAVPGTERSGEPGLNRQVREAGKSFADSNEYYYEDGSTSSSSHYSKYTYLHHSMRLVGVADWNDQKVSDARKYFYANVTPTQDGFLWEVTVNSGHFDNYLTSSLWITTPDTQKVVANSIKVTKFGRDGQRLDTYDGAASTIEEQLRRAGMGRVTLGKVSETNVRRGGAGAAAYRTNNLEDLARESFDKSGGGERVGEIGFYRRWRESGSQQNRANEKFNMINGSNSDLHYFELPENRDGSSFVISFKTKGDNNPQKLVYSGGLKAIRMNGAEQRRTLVNQMYAQTPTERDYTDQYPIHVVGNGTFFVKQGKYYNTAYGRVDSKTDDVLFGNVLQGRKYDYSPFRADGILGNDASGRLVSPFDLNQYTAPPGVNTPSSNYSANAAGQTWEYYDADGKKLSARDIGEHGADKPGLVEYLLKRTFTKDGSQDNYKIRFVVKPKQPTLVGDLGFVGEKTSGLRAENGTKDIPVTLYRKVDGVEKPIEVKTVKADANGVANFGEVNTEEGTYYVQTSMTTDQYVDYSGNTHNKVESDKSARQITAIVPPKVKVQNTELSATTAKENAPVLYEVIQGQRFNPHVEAWDDKGNLNKFTITNLPQGVTANSNFRATNNATKQNTTDAIFSGNVPELQTVGEHIATVTVADESNKEKQYYFKYRVIEKDRIAPTVKIVDKTKNNTETTLTDNVSNAPTIDVYRGANIELPLKYYDNDAAGKVNIQHVSGIPRGVWFNQNASANSNAIIKESGKTENAQGSYTVRGRVDVNAPLGITTVTLKVSDAADGDVNQGNKKEVKFRVRVLDLDFEQGVSEQTGAAKISREVELNRPVGDPNNYLTVNDGSQRNDRLFPSGMTFRFISGTEYKTDLTYTDPGKYTVKAAAFYPTTYVPTNGESVVAANATATGDNISEIRGRAYVARDIEFQVKPTAPTVTPQENGDVVVAHTNQRNVKTLSFTYTNGSGAQQTVTATKNGNSWTLDNPSIDGVTIDASTGAVTIKDRAVGDASQVTAKVATSDSVNSNDTTATAKTGERIAPTFEFNSKYTEVVNGQRVVYVTPTENLSNGSITLGTVKDNSGKLLETVLFHGNGSSYNLEYGLTYNDKPRTTNGDFNAPHDIVIKGTVPKINPNTSRIWENNASLVTRYVSAMDAAENQLKNQSDQNSNPLRVQFKILTQAAKYNPQVATQAINKDITANGARLSADEFNAIKPNIRFTANKGDVKVAYNTTDMNITMNENGAVKRNSNGTYYVGATVTYPDGTSETIQIPVEKSDKIPPTVKMNGKELTENAADNHFIIYKGANFNPTFEVNDNSGVTTYLKADGIPNGVWFNKQGERDLPKTENMRNGTQYQLTTNNTVDSIAPLGDHEARVTVKDALNNEKTYKFKYTIVDVDVKDSPKNVRLNSQLGDPHHFLTTTAANRVNADDKYFPGGMQFKWIKNNQEVAQTTTLPKAGNITDYKVVAEFANGATSYVKNIDGKDVTIYTPDKVGKPVTLIVTEDSPPTVKMTNPSNNQTTELSGDDSNSPIVTIYRNGQLNIPLSFYDNEATGRVNLQYVEGLPKGVTFGGTNNTVSVTGAVANSNGRHTISGRVAADATLGMSTVTMKVSDGANGVDSGNQGEVKFRIRVLDVDFEEARSPEPNQSSITVEANVGVNVPDPNHYLTVNDGTNRTDQGNFPSGMTFRYVSSDGSSTTRTLQYNAPGQYTVKARAYFPENYAGTNGIGEVVSGQTGDNTEINGRRYIEKTIVFRVKPTTPVVAPQDNGDVVITQPNETNVNRLSVTYTRQDNPEEVTYTAAKNGDTWSFGSNVPITIDSTTGTVKIKDRLVQDGSTVKVKAITNDGILSDEATGDAKPGDAIYPTIDFQNTETDADGNRVVYITPTEATNLDVVTINDNSNKLLEAVFFDQGATLTDLGNYGLTYNKVIRNGDTITNAPLTFTVRGTLNKIKSGSTLWGDDEVITTRYASAMDAAENNIRDKSGSRDNVASNPYRVVFKTLTQATKYTPTVSKSKIERDITQANTTITATEFNKIKDTLTFSSTRGEVKVNKNTSGLQLAMKNSTVQTKQDGTLYITATVTYPDGSREDIEVPLDTTNANKAKPTLTIPEVSVKAAKSKGEQGSVPATEYNRVLNNVTVPQAQPQPTAKEVKNNGRISMVDGKNVVTVGLTFSDNTKKDVTVPVLEVKPVDITTTFNELDNTVTVKPNTTVENGDKLHVTIRGVGMQLTKTDTGYTNSRNDRDITVNSDGSITISLLGNETFQAGDRVVTRHESNKNGKVDSYETEAFAGLKPVEKVPAINLTNLTPKEIEDVKAAVKKANPSVNVDELQVAPNGDVTYTHRGEGVGENDPAQTFTLRDNVRERNDAEKIDPNVTPLTRHDQAPKHTEAQVTGAVTGEKITGKRVVGEIPDGTGEATVEVTYEDGSKENVKVQITVTPSDATTVTPTVTPVVRDDQHKPNNDDVTAAVTLPEGTTGKSITNKEVVGNVPTEVGGPTNVVVKVTYGDGSTENVDVPVLVVGLPSKTPAKDKAHLTPEEKKQVEDKVKAKNPGKKVTVGDDGTATVTDPTTGISHKIPGTDLVNQDFEPVKPTEKVPVKDKAHLTPEEKKQVQDKVKDKNPGKEVTVGDDGTATVTDPTTGTSHKIPGTDLVNQDFEPVKPTEKVPVKDKAHLTPEEKKQVADKVKAKNPGKEVTVGDDGTATVTDPTTGITHTIPGSDLVNQDFEPVIPADKIPVKDPANLTQEEQDKVKESVEKANPGKKVTVDKTGKVTITDPNTNISHEIPGEKLITLDPPVVVIPEYTEPIGTTGVDGNGNLLAPPIVNLPELIITKWTDEAGKELKAADAKAPKVLGEANEALEAGEIAGYEFVRTETKDDVVTHIFRKVTPIKLEGNANNQSTSTAKVEKSTKRLANTGEAETNTGLAGLGLAALGSLLAVAKRRKKDEE